MRSDFSLNIKKVRFSQNVCPHFLYEVVDFGRPWKVSHEKIWLKYRPKETGGDPAVQTTSRHLFYPRVTRSGLPRRSEAGVSKVDSKNPSVPKNNSGAIC